jgi:FKBP-type peptidyl-prolyl cis-trans isomerase
MKQLFFALLCLFAAACNSQKETKTALTTNADSVSYSIGVNIGTTLHRQGVNIQPDAFIRGIKDASDSSSKRLIPDEKMNEVMTVYQQKLIAERSEKAKKEGDSFLAENKTKPGVITTGSGLQYKIITEGKGKKPRPTDQVIIHYRGTLTDGTEFDNSYKRGEPITLPVSGVIAGWTEALQLMPVGSKWQLFIPPNLGYGERSTGTIPPGSTLIFDVELLGIK